MKKIIWIFGEPGAGKRTLIDKLYSNSSDVTKFLGIENSNMDFVVLPYDRDSILTDYKALDVRKKTIYRRIKEFSTDTNDVLIIKGEYADHESSENSIITEVATDFPNIEKEILFLNPSDINLLHERLKNTEWFKSDYEKNLTKFPIEWLDFSIEYIRKELINCEQKGYKFYEVDTLDGYTFVTEEKNKVI